MPVKLASQCIQRVEAGQARRKMSQGVRPQIGRALL